MIDVVVTVLWGVRWFITTVGGIYDKHACGCYSVVRCLLVYHNSGWNI